MAGATVAGARTSGAAPERMPRRPRRCAIVCYRLAHWKSSLRFHIG
jgi:hypothetical protein